MTDRLTRLYTLVVAVLVFVVAWAAVAARPWAATGTDPRLAALTQREQRLRADAVRVRAIVNARTAAYRSAVAAQRRAQAASASGSATTVAAVTPAVRVVNLPPLTITRTS